MSKLNCPNCGAPIDPETNKCSYCSTSYFDLSSIDFTENKPVYLKLRTYTYENKPVTITMKCIPHMGNVEVTYDTVDCTCMNGNIIKYAGEKHVTTDISFEGIAESGNIFRVDIE